MAATKQECENIAIELGQDVIIANGPTGWSKRNCHNQYYYRCSYYFPVGSTDKLRFNVVCGDNTNDNGMDIKNLCICGISMYSIIKANRLVLGKIIFSAIAIFSNLVNSIVL